MWSGRVYIKIRRRLHGDRPYEYLAIAVSFKSQGKVGHRTLGSLGRRVQLTRRRSTP